MNFLKPKFFFAWMAENIHIILYTMGKGGVHRWMCLICGHGILLKGILVSSKGLLAPSPTTRALSMFYLPWGLNQEPTASLPISQQTELPPPPVFEYETQKPLTMPVIKYLSSVLNFRRFIFNWAHAGVGYVAEILAGWFYWYE